MAEKKAKKVKRVKPGRGKVKVYSLDGSVSKELDLPDIFNFQFRPDIISRASTAIWANKRQPYAPKATAGMRHSVSTWGKGRGVSRVQRLKQGSTAAESPGNVGGRRAHPPKTNKNLKKRINRKEMRFARLSALAAVSDYDRVISRGHKIPEEATLPIVVDNEVEKIETTKEALNLIENIGLGDDIDRAIRGKRVRAGRGKMRGRKYRSRKSLLVVLTKESPARKSFSNIQGVDVAATNSLNADLLAPGGLPGRLTLFSEAAFEEIGKWSS